MAANMFVKMPERNCHKIAAVLIYALLEWILIILLLLNSLFSHLIQKFAEHFSLKPSCTWCTRLDQAKVHRSNVCASHGIEIARLSYCTNHRRLADSKNLCGDCSSFSMNDGINIMQENNEERINDICSCCDKILSRKNLYCDNYLCDANLGSKEDDESRYITNNMLLENEEEESDGFICIELIDNSQQLLTNISVESKLNEGSTLDNGSKISETEQLRASIKAQEKAMNELYEELEEERKSAAISANQTMAMINKLQEEKSAMQMEALQYQRMMEEQAEYDQEALQLLNDLVLKRDKEKQVLENELQIYRNSFADFEGKNGGIIVNSVDKFNGISIAEFDEERVCILEELKVLGAKLFSLHDDDDDDDDVDDDAHEEFNENSMIKGNKGIVLLQEILQHLQDLRSVEYSFRKLAEIPLA